MPVPADPAPLVRADHDQVGPFGLSQFGQPLGNASARSAARQDDALALALKRTGSSLKN